MEQAYQEAYLNALSCLAWADGHLSKEEEDKIIEIIFSMGEITDKSIIQKHIQKSTSLNEDILQQLQTLPDDFFTSLICFAFDIVHIDNSVTPEEIKLLRQIASTKLSQEKVEKLSIWFEHKKTADNLFDEIFD